LPYVLAGAAALAALAGATAWLLPRDADVRRRIVRTLAERFDAEVELQYLRVSVFPRPRIEGGGLQLTPRDRPGSAPLLAVARFSAYASWPSMIRRPRRVEQVEIEGLRITITPRPGDSGVRGRDRGGCAGRRDVEPAASRQPGTSPVLIERLTAPGSEIVLLPRDPAKQPRRFSIASLTVRDITLDRPLQFDAVLTNPTPRGQVTTRGAFGPWVAREPGRSAVEGRYRFEHVNLATIRGIAGGLTSTGRFEGQLQQILVTGATDTPDFSLEAAGQSLPLRTEFQACVDGTDGDTYLDRVEARLASTPIVATGKVEGRAGKRGRTVALEVSVADGRIEDLLTLAAKGDPLLRGPVSLSHTLLLPPGPGRIVTRLRLSGRFGLAETRFAGRALQGKLDEFSRKGQGRPNDASVRDVASEFRGTFALSDGTLRLPKVSFAIPGARLVLGGRYDLVSERMDFAGTVRLEAKVSETTTGVKSLLLEALDPLFSRKDAGTVLPIRISGTRREPKFDVDIRRAITRRDK
jgi:hypothetical protein